MTELFSKFKYAFSERTSYLLGKTASFIDEKVSHHEQAFENVKKSMNPQGLCFCNSAELKQAEESNEKLREARLGLRSLAQGLKEMSLSLRVSPERSVDQKNFPEKDLTPSLLSKFPFSDLKKSFPVQVSVGEWVDTVQKEVSEQLTQEVDAVVDETTLFLQNLIPKADLKKFFQISKSLVCPLAFRSGQPHAISACLALGVIDFSMGVDDFKQNPNLKNFFNLAVSGMFVYFAAQQMDLIGKESNLSINNSGDESSSGLGTPDNRGELIDSDTGGVHKPVLMDVSLNLEKVFVTLKDTALGDSLIEELIQDGIYDLHGIQKHLPQIEAALRGTIKNYQLLQQQSLPEGTTNEMFSIIIDVINGNNWKREVARQLILDFNIHADDIQKWAYFQNTINDCELVATTLSEQPEAFAQLMWQLLSGNSN